MAASPLSITNVDSPRSGPDRRPDPVHDRDHQHRWREVSNAVLTDQYNGLVGFGNPPLLDAVSSRGSCSQNNTQVTCHGGAIGRRRRPDGDDPRRRLGRPCGTTINNSATVTGTKAAPDVHQLGVGHDPRSRHAAGRQLARPDDRQERTAERARPVGRSPTTMTVNNIGNATATGIKGHRHACRDDVSSITVGGHEPVHLHPAERARCCRPAFAVTVTPSSVARSAQGRGATITVHGTSVQAPGRW